MEEPSALDAGRLTEFKWTYRALDREALIRLTADRATLEREAAAALDAVLAERGVLPADVLASRYRGFGGFLSRHFNGDYSLGRSYWVHVFLLSTLGSMAVFSLLPVLGPALSATHLSLALLAGLAFMAAIWVWGVIGTWRSADKHRARGGRALWAGLARIAIVLGVLRSVGDVITLMPVVWEHAKVAFGEQPGEAVQLVVRADGKSLLLRGGINDHTAAALDQALSQAPQVTTVVLESAGGWIRQGRLIGKVIARRGLDTYVETECTSACTIAFLAGKDRAIAPKARLGFHAFRGIGGVKSWDTEQAVYGESGLETRFIQRIAATPSHSVWYPDPGELLGQRVITRRSMGGETAALATTTKSRGEVREAFLQHGTYSLIAERYPARFDAIVDAAWGAMQQRKIDREVFAAARTELASLSKGLLAASSDATLLSFVVLMADQAQALQPTAPDLCSEVIFRRSGKPLDLRELLPASFAGREENLLRAMIATSTPANVIRASNAEVDAALQSLFARMRARDVSAVRSLSTPNPSPAESTCAAGISLLDTLLRQEPRHRSRNMRILFGT